MTTPTCKDCVFFDFTQPNLELGVCRRHAPKSNLMFDLVRSLGPIMAYLIDATAEGKHKDVRDILDSASVAAYRLDEREAWTTWPTVGDTDWCGEFQARPTGQDEGER